VTNLLLICLDTFRRDCVGVLSDNAVETPNLDGLCAQGIVFENAFGEAQPTIQFRRGLLTGMRAFPWRYDYDTRGLWPSIRGWHKVCPEHDMLSEILLRNGYTTGFFSDTYHMFKPTMNFTRGYTSWEFIRGQESDNYRSGPLEGVDLRGYLPPGQHGAVGEGRKACLLQYLLNNQNRKTEKDWTSARAFEAAGAFLEANARSQQFFLYVDSFDPHEPWDPPRHYADRYDPDWHGRWEPIEAIGARPNEETKRRVKALYHGECSFVDAHVGRLLTKLEELALAHNTLVIVTSDHGTELWDHGAVRKGPHSCRYRHNTEIIWIMRAPQALNAQGRAQRKARDGKVPDGWPDSEAAGPYLYSGRIIKGFVQNHDILPTVLPFLGIEHEPVDGLDAWPLVTGEKDRVRDYVVSGWEGRAAVRDERYAYSVDFGAEDGKEHLFDVINDPEESRNLVCERTSTCSEYRRRLERCLGQDLPVLLPALPQDEIHRSEMPVRTWARSNPSARRKLSRDPRSS